MRHLWRRGGRGTFAGMATSRSRIKNNLARVQANVEAACKRSGRSVRGVSVMAVTKTVDLDAIKVMLELGCGDIGESRAPQLLQRAEDLAAHIQRRRSAYPVQPKWHMIGHLQRNKIKSVLESDAVIHSVDSLRLAEEINSRAQRAGKTVDVFLQVNCSEEPQKHGVAVGAAAYLGELVGTMEQIHLVGLMTMAPLSEQPDDARPTFIRLRELFEEMRHSRVGGEHFTQLSMGMSQDYEVAVEEGATVLRIGTAIFEQE